MAIALSTFFTKRWCYSVQSWARHVFPAISGEDVDIVLSTDNSDECAAEVEVLKKRFSGFRLHHVRVDCGDDAQKAYKDEAQLIIAKLQQAAFCRAREIRATGFWSVESDILVPPNSLRVLRQALEFDDGYYSVAMVTYPNGQFLGGRGSPSRPIEEDFKPEERKLTNEIKSKIKKKEERLKELAKKHIKPSKEEMSEWDDLDKKIKECPPIGNIFELQSKGWRKRGWLESAYPAIGRGAILPTDWVGLGCTLLNKKALELSTFEGYELKGTQDLFLCWHRWNPNGLKMCVIPHILCSHVKRKVDKDGNRTDEIEIYEAYHETVGEFEGHLRWRPRKYINFNE